MDGEDLNNRIDKRIHEHQQILEPEIKEVSPSYIPRYHCKDGNCGKSHPNENFKDYPKGKCTNCDQFSGTINKRCTWCGNDEYDELSKDDLDDVINYDENKKSGWW